MQYFLLKCKNPPTLLYICAAVSRVENLNEKFLARANILGDFLHDFLQKCKNHLSLLYIFSVVSGVENLNKIFLARANILNRNPRGP